MGGSGGGGPYFNVRPEDLRERVKEATEEIAREFAPGLQSFLDGKLSAFNSRDVNLVEQRQAEILNVLGNSLESNLDLRFGGSVARHTYVDGLSDIDSLLILREGNTEESPKRILQSVAQRLSEEVNAEGVAIGRLAVTVRFADGMEIQLIPAVRDGPHIRIPSWRKDGWSRIDPKAFSDALTRRNRQCGYKLVPVIKLAKAVIATWPTSVQMTGYHVESLAIDAFRGYAGPQNTREMLPYFFERSATSVLSPVRDKTGQSIHVDTYLGKARGPERQKVSHWLSQVAKKMRTASTQGSLNQWRELFE